MISGQNPNLSLGLNPHLLNDLPSFPQQAPHMHPRHDEPRHRPVPAPSVLVLPTAVRVALHNPLVNQQQRLLRRREGRHSPVGVPPPRVRDLDDPLAVPADELVDVDPRARVLPYGLDDGAGLADHAPGLGVVAEDPVARGDHEGRVLPVPPAPAAAAPAAAVPVRGGGGAGGGVVVVVVPGLGPAGGLGIVVIIVVVAPLGSGSLHS